MRESKLLIYNKRKMISYSMTRLDKTKSSLSSNVSGLVDIGLGSSDWIILEMPTVSKR
jgi:hypothetical protein